MLHSAKLNFPGMISVLVDNWRSGMQSQIARRFVFYTVLSSTLLALVATSVQLYSDYHDDLSALEKIVDNIKHTRLHSLVESLWAFERIQIEGQLQGMLRQTGIEFVEITQYQETLYSNGKIVSANNVEYKFPLIKNNNNLEHQLGELHVTIGLDQIYATLIHRAIVVLISNSIKTLLVATIIIVIYQILIGRHIAHLASFTGKSHPESKTDRFSLNRRGVKSDELNKLEIAVNRWMDDHRTYEAKLLQMNADLLITNTKLKNANYELSRFAYSTSHDLKAPLASIIGMLEFSEADIQQGNSEEALLTTGHAKTLANRLVNRIEDMLVLAKSDAEDDKREPIDVEKIVDSIWKDISLHYNEKTAKLMTGFLHEAAPELVPIRFQIILENLLSNAFKYSSPARELIEVDIVTESNGNRFILSVTDNGAGIPEKYHDQVFGMFNRFSDSDQPGSGLGLAIVKKNVEKLGGTIDFTSSPEGSCFRISLPSKINNKLEPS